MDRFEAAKLYTSWGWIIHPLSSPKDQGQPSPGKRPLLKEWTERRQAAEDELKEWFLGSDFNVGLVAGKNSGVSVIDFDQQLCMRLIFPEEVDTMKSRRTEGRGHVFLKYDADIKPFKNSDLGVEFLSTGNNVVLPPSIHVSGETYRWNREDGKIHSLSEREKEMLKAIARHKTRLSQMRPCIVWLIEKNKNWHGADGRQCMVAVATELKANKGNEFDILVLVNRVLGGEFDKDETLKEWKNIDQERPWKCSTIRTSFPETNELCKNCRSARKRSFKLDSVYSLMHERKFITLAETDELYHYNDGIYHKLGEVLVKSKVQALFDDVNTTQVNEIINTVKRKTYISMRELNKHVHLIPIENGYFNMETMRLEEPNPDIYFTNKIPVKYNPEAKCPTIEKFMAEVLVSEDIPVIYEFFGYCLLRGYPIQKTFMLVGSGANGKSTLLGLLRAFLGEGAVASVSLQEIEENKFAAANLFGKLANVYADLPPKALYTTGKIKMLTGKDPITVERKFGGFFDFVNYAKLIFSANQLPTSYDDTDAFFRRWVIIAFPNKFEAERDDPYIINKLTTPEELSGLFNKAIEGLRRLLKNNGFTGQKSTEQIREQYIRLSDSIQSFIWDCIEQSAEGYIEKDPLFNLYVGYCKMLKLPSVSKKRFFERFPSLIRIEEYRPPGDKRQRAYRGIVIKVEATQEASANLPQESLAQKEICEICKEELTGEVLQGPPGWGAIHKKCQIKPMRVKFLAPIPAFTAADFNRYGPYMPGDEATLPFIHAHNLISKRAAEEIKNV